MSQTKKCSWTKPFTELYLNISLREEIVKGKPDTNWLHYSVIVQGVGYRRPASTS